MITPADTEDYRITAKACREVEKYWHSRGFHAVHTELTIRSGMYSIESNLVGGLPPGFGANDPMRLK